MHVESHPRVSERGMSMLLVVATVLATIVFSAASFLLYAQMADKEATKAALQARKKELLDQRGRLQFDFERAVVPTGFGIQAGEPGTREVRERLAQLKKETVIDPLRALADELRRSKDAAVRDLVPPSERLAKGMEDLPSLATLENLVSPLSQALLQQKAAYERKRVEAFLWKLRAEEAEALTAQGEKTFGEFKDYVSGPSGLTKKLSDVVSERKSAYEGVRTGRKKELDQVEEENGTLERELRTLRIRFQLNLSKAEQQLEDLKRKEIVRYEITPSYGQILRPDHAQRLAFISLGTEHQILPGMKFKVARPGIFRQTEEGGDVHLSLEYKGEVEVKKAWPTYSEVSLTELIDPYTPIVEGDPVVNPFYHPRRPIRVAFASSGAGGQAASLGIPDMPRARHDIDSLDEITNRIREMKGEVRDRVDIDVDFVMLLPENILGRLGEHPKQELFQRNYMVAQQLEIPIMKDPREVFSFLGD